MEGMRTHVLIPAVQSSVPTILHCDKSIQFKIEQLAKMSHKCMMLGILIAISYDREVIQNLSTHNISPKLNWFRSYCRHQKT